MYYALKYCQELHYSYVQLECYKNLVPYYMDVCGFRLGSSPSFNLTSSLYEKRKIHKVIYEDEYYMKAIDDSWNYLEKQFGDRNKLHRKMSEYKDELTFPLTIDHKLEEHTLFKMHKPLDRLSIDILKTHILSDLKADQVKNHMFFGKDKELPIYFYHLRQVANIPDDHEIFESIDT